MAQYDFNDHAYLRFAETIKDALDPNGILAPGQAGDLAEGAAGDAALDSTHSNTGCECIVVRFVATEQQSLQTRGAA